MRALQRSEHTDTRTHTLEMYVINSRALGGCRDPQPDVFLKTLEEKDVMPVRVHDVLSSAGLIKTERAAGGQRTCVSHLRHD